MTTLKNAIIINHRVLHPPKPGIPKKYTYTPYKLETLLDYTTRTGRSLKTEGCDNRITLQDEFLERRKTYENAIDQILSYGDRSGIYAGRGIDNPITPGETSGGIWDAHGICNKEDIKREILESGSNVVQSVVTIQREWVEPLHMASKEDWQQLMRTKWASFVKEWGVIPDNKVRWAAEYHVDGAKSLHVHVLTWEKDGQHFHGKNGIPQKAIEPSKRVIREAVMANLRLERSLEKDYVRQATLELTRQALGHSTFAEFAQVQVKAEHIGEVFAPEKFTNSGELQRQLEHVIKALPDACMGRKGYLSQDKECRAQANLAINELRRDEQFEGFYQRMIGLIERGADIVGLSGKEREQYISKEIRDYNQRIANVVLTEATRLNTPWQRFSELSIERNQLLNALTRSVPFQERVTLMNEPENTRDKRAEQTLDSQELDMKITNYLTNVISRVQSVHPKELTDEQIDRLYDRTLYDLRRALVWRFAEGPSTYERDRELKRSTRKLSLELGKTLAPAATRSLLIPEQRKVVKHQLKLIHDAWHEKCDHDELARRAVPVVKLYMNTIEVKASIERTYQLNAYYLGDDGRERVQMLAEQQLIEQVINHAICNPDRPLALTLANLALTSIENSRWRGLSLDDEEDCLTIQLRPHRRRYT